MEKPRVNALLQKVRTLYVRVPAGFQEGEPLCSAIGSYEGTGIVLRVVVEVHEFCYLDRDLRLDRVGPEFRAPSCDGGNV